MYTNSASDKAYLSDVISVTVFKMHVEKMLFVESFSTELTDPFGRALFKFLLFLKCIYVGSKAQGTLLRHHSLTLSVQWE